MQSPSREDRRMQIPKSTVLFLLASRLGLSFTEWESVMEQLIRTPARIRWNNGKLVGQKAPLKLKDIWAIRVRL